MAELPNVRLDLANRPENVLLVRQVLTGLAEAIDLDANDLHDLTTAVTEACNNVVLHAYPGEEGPLEVEVYSSSQTIEIVVRDHGAGIRPRIQTAEENATGIGLPVIQALADGMEVRETAAKGTEVRMRFAMPKAAALGLVHAGELKLPAIAQRHSATTMAVAIAPADLARAVLPRLLSALAARAHFCTDRISDTQMVADALAAHASESISGNHLGVGINVRPRNLELLIGPLRTDRKQWLPVNSAIQGLDPLVERLTDDHDLAKVGSSEVLALRLLDRS
jgi:anti-sigma regulatory factor (Ser/Thr protein kinase)